MLHCEICVEGIEVHQLFTRIIVAGKMSDGLKLWNSPDFATSHKNGAIYFPNLSLISQQNFADHIFIIISINCLFAFRNYLKVF